MMEQKIEKILDLMIKGLEKAGSVAESELPGLLSEYVTYFAIDAFPAGSLVMFIGGLVTWSVGKKTARRLSDSEKEYLNVVGSVFPFYLFMMIVITGILVSSSKDTIQLLTAPKAALVEKFRK